MRVEQGASFPRQDFASRFYKGSKFLPDIRTAALALLRGYVNGFYPAPLEGIARDLGYYPLETANEEELSAIDQMIADYFKNLKQQG